MIDLCILINYVLLIPRGKDLFRDRITLSGTLMEMAKLAQYCLPAFEISKKYIVMHHTHNVMRGISGWRGEFGGDVLYIYQRLQERLNGLDKMYDSLSKYELM